MSFLRVMGMGEDLIPRPLLQNCQSPISEKGWLWGRLVGCFQLKVIGERFADALQDFIGLFENLDIGETENAVAESGEEAFAFLVGVYLLLMHFAVDFNDQGGLGAVEVDENRPIRRWRWNLEPLNRRPRNCCQSWSSAGVGSGASGGPGGAALHASKGPGEDNVWP